MKTPNSGSSMLERLSCARQIRKSATLFLLKQLPDLPNALHQQKETLARVFPVMLCAALLLGFGPMAHADHDNDGVPDTVDNCTNVANPGQRDTDGDGYGNSCDLDLNNDGVVNLSDYSLFRSAFGSVAHDTAPFTMSDHADSNGDGSVNLSDFSLLRSMFGLNPGPSALSYYAGDAPMVVSWVAPTARENGESLSLSELDRYEITLAPTSGGVSSVIVVADPSVSAFQISGLDPGTYQLSMVAVDTSGNASEGSDELSVMVD